MFISRLPRSVLMLFIGYAVNFFGSGLTLPFLMVYLHTIRHVSMPAAGFILSLSSIVGFVTTPLAGWTIDRIGAFRTLLIAVTVLGIGTACYAVAVNYIIAMVAAILTGIGNAMMWSGLSAQLAVLAGRTMRSSAFGISYAVQNLGLGLGSGVAGLMVHSGTAVSYMAIFLVDGLTYLLFIPFLFATQKPANSGRPLGAEGAINGAQMDDTASGHLLEKEQGPVGYRHVLRDWALVSVTLLNFFFVIFGFSQLTSSFSTWTAQYEGSFIAGSAFFANCIAIAIFQVPVLHWTEHWRRTRLAAMCGVCFTLCWGITIVASRGQGMWAAIGLILALTIFGIGETFLSASLTPMVNDLSPNALRGRYNAFFNLSWPAGTAIGPVIAGLALERGLGLWLFIGLAVVCLMTAVWAIGIERIVPIVANKNRQDEGGDVLPTES